MADADLEAPAGGTSDLLRAFQDAQAPGRFLLPVTRGVEDMCVRQARWDEIWTAAEGRCDAAFETDTHRRSAGATGGARFARAVQYCVEAGAGREWPIQRYAADEGRWYRWNRRYWHVIDEKEARKLYQAMGETAGWGVGEVKNAALGQETYSTCTQASFQEPRNILNCLNGCVDLRTGILDESEPRTYEDVLLRPWRSCWNFEFRTIHLATPAWERVRDVYPEQMAVIDQFLVAIMHGDTSARSMLLIYGPRHTGKTAIIRPLVKKAFAHCSSTLSLHDFSDDVTRFSMFPLLGKRVNIDLDMRLSPIPIPAVAVVKKLCDGLPFVFNPKGKPQFEAALDPFFCINITNQLQRFGDAKDREAFLRRVIMVYLGKTQTADPMLEDELLEQADQYLSNLIRDHPYGQVRHGDQYRNKDRQVEDARIPWDRAQYWYKTALDAIVEYDYRDELGGGMGSQWPVHFTDLAVSLCDWEYERANPKLSTRESASYMARRLPEVVMEAYGMESERETSRSPLGYPRLRWLDPRYSRRYRATHPKAEYPTEAEEAGTTREKLERIAARSGRAETPDVDGLIRGEAMGRDPDTGGDDR